MIAILALRWPVFVPKHKRSTWANGPERLRLRCGTNGKPWVREILSSGERAFLPRMRDYRNADRARAPEILDRFVLTDGHLYEAYEAAADGLTDRRFFVTARDGRAVELSAEEARAWDSANASAG